VEVKEGDVRQLPFADASFDVILSNFVVHEVNNRAEREQMLREMVRVLEPGGRLALVDFIFTGECVRVFQEIGIADAKRSRVEAAGQGSNPCAPASCRCGSIQKGSGPVKQSEVKNPSISWGFRVSRVLSWACMALLGL
jgi:SAM-dependent methyltransferase